jgi:hypothetical protein
MSGSHTYGDFRCAACMCTCSWHLRKETIIWACTCAQESSTDKPPIQVQDSMFMITRALNMFGFQKISEDCQGNSWDHL